MTAQRQIAVVGDYMSLISALRARVDGLNITYATLDELAGWHDGYSNKLLIEEPTLRGSTKNTHSQRIMGIMAFDAILGALGVKLALIEDPAALARIKRNRYFEPRKRPSRLADGKSAYILHRVTSIMQRENAAKGGEARARKLSPAKRKSIAKKAGKSYGENTTPELRRSIAQKGGKARWRKPTITQIAPTSAADKPTAPHSD